ALHQTANSGQLALTLLVNRVLRAMECYQLIRGGLHNLEIAGPLSRNDFPSLVQLERPALAFNRQRRRLWRSDLRAHEGAARVAREPCSVGDLENSPRVHQPHRGIDRVESVNSDNVVWVERVVDIFAQRQDQSR